MKKKFLLPTMLMIGAAMIFTAPSNTVHSLTSGAPAGRTGSPGDGQTCYSGCHGNSPGNGIGREQTGIDHDIPVGGYIPGNTYNVSVTMSGAGIGKFGFTLSPQNTSGTVLGDLISGSGSQLNGGGNYITHTPSGTISTDQKTWDFQWQAPATGAGDVTFYAASIYANQNGSNSGDFMVLAETATTEDVRAGIFDVVDGGRSIFPMPAVSEIHLGTEPVKQGFQFQILDLSGRTVQAGSLNPGENPVIDLDRTSIKTGVYILRANNIDGEELMTRIMVK